MARYDYTADQTEHGILVFQTEAELEVQASVGEQFDVTVTAVFVNGVDLLQSSNSAYVGMGLDIAAMAETDKTFTDLVMADEKVVYRGLGHNDPSGHFIRAVVAA